MMRSLRRLSRPFFFGSYLYRINGVTCFWASPAVKACCRTGGTRPSPFTPGPYLRSGPEHANAQLLLDRDPIRPALCR